MAVPSKKRKIFDGRYEIITIVGRGSDSVVYQARHVGPPAHSSQDVALKVLLNPKDQKDKLELADRLRKEALTLVSCRHRYVVRLDDFHSIGELCYLSMEFAAEGDLRKFANSLGGKIDVDRASRFFEQSLEGFDYIHTTGILHRDVKPDNILVMNDAEIRIADFGLSLLPGDEPQLEDLRQGVGTFTYLPPEMLEGIRYDHRSDLYALGVSFYEIIAGTNPFEKASLAGQMEIREDGRVPLLHTIDPSVPELLSRIIAKMMRYDANDRFPSALDALRVLTDETLANHFLETERRGGDTSSATSSSPDADPITPFGQLAENADDSPDSKIFDTASEDSPHGEIASADAERSIDPPSPPRGERIPPPTEKIDLERIKEIIAKDQQRSAEAANRRSPQQGRSRKPTPAESRRQSSNQFLPASISNSERRESDAAAHFGRSFFSRATQGFLQLPRPLQPIIAGCLATVVITVGISVIGGIAQLLRGSEDEEAGTTTTTIAQEDSEATNDSEQEGTKISAENHDGSGEVFANLEAGMYAGEIQNLVAGRSVPFAVLALPKKERVAVMIGIEGWQPLLVATKGNDGSELSTLTVRSSGMVLDLAGALNGDKASGIFTNGTTGVSGRWRVAKVKQG